MFTDPATYLILSPFAIILAFMFWWTGSRFILAFRHKFIWKEETVQVKKSYQNELPFFSYELHGRKLTSNRLPDGVADGESITFIFPPGEPEKAIEKSNRQDWSNGVIFFLVAYFFSGFFAWMLIGAFDQSGLQKDLGTLKQTGKKIVIPLEEATVQSHSCNDGHVGHYWVNVTWQNPATNLVHEFESRQFYFNISDQLKNREQATVYVDPIDYGRYYMDISFKPNVTLVKERPTSNDDDFTSMAWVCTLFGLLLTSVAGFFLYLDYSLVISGLRAKATVLNFVTRNTSSGYVYYPVIHFQSDTGKNITLELPEGTNPPSYEIGDQVKVFYELENPENITSLNYGFIIMKSVFGSIGLALMLAGVYFFTN